MPGLMIDKLSMNSFILAGNKILFSCAELHIAFIGFLGLYYVLDVDYPLGFVIPFSILHRIIFNDNRDDNATMAGKNI